MGMAKSVHVTKTTKLVQSIYIDKQDLSDGRLDGSRSYAILDILNGGREIVTQQNCF